VVIVVSNKSKVLATIHIDGKKLLMNRSGKANRHDDDVTRGCGTHVPKKHKEKSKQKIKNSLKEEY